MSLDQAGDNRLSQEQQDEEAQFREGLAGLAAYHAAGYPDLGEADMPKSSTIPPADIRIEELPEGASEQEQRNWGLRALAARDQAQYREPEDDTTDEGAA